MTTTLSDFDIFARVARTGNMSAAGRELGVSPAVVSKRISLLEERLGARLFQRTTRQLTLTETGEGYFKRIVDILNLVAEADDFVSRRNLKPKGVLKVSAPTSFARLHIAPNLDRFVKEYPQIDVDLNLSDGQFDLVREGFDLAIRIGDLPDSSLVARKIAADRQIICATPSYLSVAGVPETVEDLAHHNCLTSNVAGSWRLEGPDGPISARIHGNIKCNSNDFLREAVLKGLGLGLRSVWEVQEEIRRGELKQVLPGILGGGSTAIFAVYPSRDFMPAKVNAFIDFFHDTLSESFAFVENGQGKDGGKPQKFRAKA